MKATPDASTIDDDLVWRALAAPVRRRILDALRDGPRTTGELAEQITDLSRFAVMQHLSVLVEASLVLVHRDGRQRWNSLNALPLRRAVTRWVTPYHEVWADRMLALKAIVEDSGRSHAAALREEPEHA